MTALESFDAAKAPPDRRPRIAGCAIGGLTLALSCWWLAASLLVANPRLAAEVGQVRGAFWSRYGWSLMSGHDVASDRARATFERAIRLAPFDSSAWFGLAKATARLGWIDRTSARALKMSYYTGAPPKALMGERLAMLAESDTSSDSELKDMLARQTALVLTRMPELEGALTKAYQAAPPANRQIIDDKARELGRDPARLFSQPAK